MKATKPVGEQTTATAVGQQRPETWHNKLFSVPPCVIFQQLPSRWLSFKPTTAVLALTSPTFFHIFCRCLFTRVWFSGLAVPLTLKECFWRETQNSCLYSYFLVTLSPTSLLSLAAPSAIFSCLSVCTVEDVNHDRSKSAITDEASTRR